MTTMKPWMLLAAIAASSLSTTTAGATDLTPAIVTNLTGSLHIQQGMPCGGADLDQTQPLVRGQLILAPAEGTPVTGGRTFTFGRVEVGFAGFSVHRTCGPVGETRTYNEIDVQLARTVSFVAAPSSAGPDIFSVAIPKDDLLLFQTDQVNGTFEAAYLSPSQDASGTIDLAHGTVQLHVVVATSIHFQAGCVGSTCVVDETRPGVMTADISGTLAFPDADHDGVVDRADNCRFVANPDQSPVATPTISAPPAVTFASCADHAIGIGIGTDVCDGGPVTVTNDAPATFAVGANTVTWTATDASGHPATAAQTITIVDTTKPTFTSVPLDVTAGDCGPVSLGTATAVDDCAGTPSIANDAPSTFAVGETVVTWTATDASGNATTATEKVTVTDTVAPSASCVASSPLGHEFVVSSGDACGAATIRLGSFVLANGERVMVHEVGQSGVTFVGVVGPDAIRHFHAGPGETVITATDPSGNVTTAACR
jgi:hypothetical protein